MPNFIYLCQNMKNLGKLGKLCRVGPLLDLRGLVLFEILINPRGGLFGSEDLINHLL